MIELVSEFDKKDDLKPSPKPTEYTSSD